MSWPREAVRSDWRFLILPQQTIKKHKKTYVFIIKISDDWAYIYRRTTLLKYFVRLHRASNSGLLQRSKIFTSQPPSRSLARFRTCRHGRTWTGRWWADRTSYSTARHSRQYSWAPARRWSPLPWLRANRGICANNNLVEVREQVWETWPLPRGRRGGCSRRGRSRSGSGPAGTAMSSPAQQ